MSTLDGRRDKKNETAAHTHKCARARARGHDACVRARKQAVHQRTLPSSHFPSTIAVDDGSLFSSSTKFVLGKEEEEEEEEEKEEQHGRIGVERPLVDRAA